MSLKFNLKFIYKFLLVKKIINDAIFGISNNITLCVKVVKVIVRTFPI